MMGSADGRPSPGRAAGPQGTLLALALTLASSTGVDAQTIWPLEPTSTDHPIGSTFGEFQGYAAAGYQHKGVDVLGRPMIDVDGDEDPNAPWVVTTVRGYVVELVESGDFNHAYNYATIWCPDDGLYYRYAHLQGGSFDPDFEDHHDDYEYGAATLVPAGHRIAKLVRFESGGGCELHHVHHDINDALDESRGAFEGDWIRPRLTPSPDTESPAIDAILFARDKSASGDLTAPWADFSPPAGGGSPKVSGKVDIVVKARDRDSAGLVHPGTETVWVHEAFWRTHRESSPPGSWKGTRALDRMPLEWGSAGNEGTLAWFSVSDSVSAGSWKSDGNYCKGTWLYLVVTDFVSGMPDLAGCWDTGPEGEGCHTVSVKLVDFAGNETIRSARVCIDRGAGCLPEATIRDAADDTGAIPYEGPGGTDSPDIAVNPGTQDEDVLRIGRPNVIRVTVWNLGAAEIPAGTELKVALTWTPGAAISPSPIPVGSASETVPSGGLAVGASRVVAFTWSPAATGDRFGVLTATLDLAGDPSQRIPIARWDDNRAGRSVLVLPVGDGGDSGVPSPRGILAPASASGEAGRPCRVDFWVHPFAPISGRALELRLDHGGTDPAIEGLRMDFVPGIVAGQVAGGSAAASGAKIRTIDGIRAAGRVELEDLRISEPVRVTLRFVPKGGARGRSSRAVIVERGRLPGHGEVSEIGRLTIPFVH